MIYKKYHFYWFAKYWIQVALRKYGKKLNGNVLDLGSGAGVWKEEIKNAKKYVGLDLDTTAKVDVLGSVEQLPFKKNCFDSAVCFQVLEHVKEPFDVILEAFRTIKSGGYFLITVPQTNPLHHYPFDYYRFTNGGIDYLSTKAGFKVVNTEAMGGLFTAICFLINWHIHNFTLKFSKIMPKRFKLFPVRILYPLYFVSNIIFGILDRIFYAQETTIGYICLCKKP